MATYLVPLEDILTDPDHPVDLTALPPHEAIERIKQLYGFWGPRSRCASRTAWR